MLRVVALLAVCALANGFRLPAGGRSKLRLRDLLIKGKTCDGGTYNDMFDKCYYFFKETTSEPSAEACGGEAEAHLVSIHSGFEQAFIYGKVRELGFSDDFWIGLKYSDAQGLWIWFDGAVANFTNWAPGFPLSGTTMPCVAIAIASGRWYNNLCNEQHQFVCDNADAGKPSSGSVTWPYTTTNYYLP